MSAIRSIYHLARADFLERVRRYSFLVVLAATLFACYQVHTGQIGIIISGHRGTMNSAWLGAVMTLTVTFLLGMVGFYIVNNSIALDERSRVGQLIAATPVSKAQYIVGKSLSNFCVLAVIVLVMMFSAAPLQLLAGEDPHIRPGALFGPFILISLPVLAMTAAVAVFFETVKWLRGALGNLSYFILFMTLLTGSIVGPYDDPTALKYFRNSMDAAAQQQLAKHEKNNFTFSIGMALAPRGFTWNGLERDDRLIRGRLEWFAIALAICALATLTFNRFESGRLREALVKATGPAKEEGGDRDSRPSDVAVGRRPGGLPHCGLLPLSSKRPRFPGVGLYRSELTILLKGLGWWWYAGLLGGVIAGLTMPAADFRQVLWFAWIWPIRVWSHMGNRESRFGTEQIVFSAPRPLLRQLPVTWLAGFSVAILAGSGVAVRMAVTGDWMGVEKVVVGAVFLASLALGLGVPTGSSKLFEAVYTVLWYIGPLNRVAAMDYTQISGAGNRSATWLAASVCLLLAAAVGRAVKLRR